MQAVPPAFVIRDEIYQVRNFSRANTHVIARLDAAKLDLTNPRVSAERRADKDFPIIWTQTYGKGRVYYNTLGHREETWDRKDVQTMYLEAIRWAMGSVGRAIVPAAGSQPALVK
jgi:type 1 glutamine amidotransferase